MSVSLRHLKSVAEDTAQLPPFAKVEQGPRAVELARHVVIRVAHLQRQSQAILRDTTRGPVVGLVAAQVRIPTDVQAQQPPLSGVPQGVDGEATPLRALVPPTAQQDALAAAVSADMRLQCLLGQAGDERERLLDGRQTPVSIHPRE